MTVSFKKPNEQQAEIMKTLGMDPKNFAVRLSSEDCFYLLHYKTGNEITIRPNILKKARNTNGSR